MPKTCQRLAKRTCNGRFVSLANAQRLLEEQRLRVLDDANSNEVNNVQEQPVVVIKDPRSNVPRRERTTGMSERVSKKFRSLELAYEGERARTSRLVEKIAEQRLEIAALQPRADMHRGKALKASRERCKQMSAELERAKECLRKAKDVNARARAKAALDAAEVARRIQIKLRATNALRARAPPRQIFPRMIPPLDRDHERSRYDFVRNHATKLQGFLS